MRPRSAGQIYGVADVSLGRGRPARAPATAGRCEVRRAARQSEDKDGSTVPTGKVKWFDAERGFGFVASDEGDEVFLHASALPAGTTVQPGARVEFGVADGRRGKQALSVRVLAAPPSMAEARRKKPEDMTVIVEDLIRLLDGVSSQLHRGRYPERGQARKVATVLRRVADDLEG